MPSDKTKQVAEVLHKVVSDAEFNDEIADKAAEQIVELFFKDRVYKPKNPDMPLGKGYARSNHKANGHGNGHDAHPIGFMPSIEEYDSKKIVETGMRLLHKANKSAEARARGFVGAVCTICGSFNTQQNGHCLLCIDCGNTTGCS